LYLALNWWFVVSLACLVRVRALASKRNKPLQGITFKPLASDDSGSKLRDKEQQRLSSK